MKVLIIAISLTLLSGCALTKQKGEDVVGMMIDNGCKVKSFAQKKGSTFKVTCFDTKSDIQL